MTLAGLNEADVTAVKSARTYLIGGLSSSKNKDDVLLHNKFGSRVATLLTKAKAFTSPKVKGNILLFTIFPAIHLAKNQIDRVTLAGRIVRSVARSVDEKEPALAYKFMTSALVHCIKCLWYESDEHAWMEIAWKCLPMLYPPTCARIFEALVQRIEEELPAGSAKATKGRKRQPSAASVKLGSWASALVSHLADPTSLKVNALSAANLMELGRVYLKSDGDPMTQKRIALLFTELCPLLSSDKEMAIWEAERNRYLNIVRKQQIETAVPKPSVTSITANSAEHALSSLSSAVDLESMGTREGSHASNTSLSLAPGPIAAQPRTYTRAMSTERQPLESKRPRSLKGISESAASVPAGMPALVASPQVKVESEVESSSLLPETEIPCEPSSGIGREVWKRSSFEEELGNQPMTGAVGRLEPRMNEANTQIKDEVAKCIKSWRRGSPPTPDEQWNFRITMKDVVIQLVNEQPRAARELVVAAITTICSEVESIAVNHGWQDEAHYIISFLIEGILSRLEKNQARPQIAITLVDQAGRAFDGRPLRLAACLSLEGRINPWNVITRLLERIGMARASHGPFSAATSQACFHLRNYLDSVQERLTGPSPSRFCGKLWFESFFRQSRTLLDNLVAVSSLLPPQTEARREIERCTEVAKSLYWRPHAASLTGGSGSLTCFASEMSRIIFQHSITAPIEDLSREVSSLMVELMLCSGLNFNQMVEAVMDNLLSLTRSFLQRERCPSAEPHHMAATILAESMPNFQVAGRCRNYAHLTSRVLSHLAVSKAINMEYDAIKTMALLAVRSNWYYVQVIETLSAELEKVIGDPREMDSMRRICLATKEYIFTIHDEQAAWKATMAKGRAAEGQHTRRLRSTLKDVTIAAALFDVGSKGFPKGSAESNLFEACREMVHSWSQAD
ncbi:hypothetical protein IE53DRAFT_384153 [Violaceomyces palustris]|uniref:Uncharacterized protein n=1 Tax=Violaceomyces palustris TaxID=1673888 RepID=A0ACD0P5Q7_9BASI|nr:hypothetical protein IE53DRAFT_384153 [Violaceomyces palustris]